MLGELKTPSKSIPQGTLRGLLVTFILYVSVIVSMGAAIPRELLYVDIKVIQTVNLSDIIIILGEFSTSLFSVIMGIVGAATMINAIADDKIIPGLSILPLTRNQPRVKRKHKFIVLLLHGLLPNCFYLPILTKLLHLLPWRF